MDTVFIMVRLKPQTLAARHQQLLINHVPLSRYIVLVIINVVLIACFIATYTRVICPTRWLPTKIEKAPSPHITAHLPVIAISQGQSRIASYASDYS